MPPSRSAAKAACRHRRSQRIASRVVAGPRRALRRGTATPEPGPGRVAGVPDGAIAAHRRVVLGVALPLLLAAGSAMAQPTAQSPGQPGDSKLSAMPSEIKKVDVKQGTGTEATSGKPVIVHYTGWIYDESKPDKKGAKFDSSRDRQQPFGFVLGAGKVIRGWDEGVAGMKVGGQP